MPDIAISREVLRQRQLKRRIIVAASAILVFPLFAWIWSWQVAGPSVFRSALTIATVKQGRMAIDVSAGGTFRPVDQRWITAISPGFVKEVRVLPGDRVQADTVIVVLANSGVDSELAQAKANLASAEAERALLKAQLMSQLLTLQGELATQDAQFKIADEKERAQRSLVDTHVVSTLDYKTTVQQAHQFERLVALATQRIDAFHQSMVAQQRAADAKVDAQKAILEGSRLRSQALNVMAGREGIVQDVAAYPGQTINVGGEIARVASVGNLKATLQVPASEAGEVDIGQSVTLQLATDVAQSLMGRVALVSPAVTNGSVDVDVLPAGPLPTGVRPNLSVTGKIHVANLPHANFIQRPAYASPQSSVTLYRLIDGGRTAVPTPVRFGVASDQLIQVISGLEPGDQAIISDTSDVAGKPRITVR